MSPEKYKVSFTTGGLYYGEAIKAVRLYAELGNWESVRAQIRSQNLLQARTQAALQRSSRELVQRLQNLSATQLTILSDGTRQEQNLILWLAVCKHYEFIRQFAVEVLREKFMRMDSELDYKDFDAFFFAKAEWNEDLENLTSTTREKLRQVLFRMLREAELLSNSGRILPAILSKRVIEAVQQENPDFLKFFPASEAKYIQKDNK